MKKNHSLIAVVMDRSGSMNPLRSAVIEGFNKFLEDQRKEKGTAEVYYTQFDNVYEVVHPFVSLDVMPNLDWETYEPRASTALLDAIGRTIVTVGENLRDRPESQRPEHVIFVVQTDGAENDSHEYNRKQVFDLIARQRDEWNWQFLFLGAGQDAIGEAQSLGFAQGQTMNFARNINAVGASMNSVSSMVSDTRMGASRDFTEEEREAASETTP